MGVRWWGWGLLGLGTSKEIFEVLVNVLMSFPRRTWEVWISMTRHEVWLRSHERLKRIEIVSCAERVHSTNWYQ